MKTFLRLALLVVVIGAMASAKAPVRSVDGPYPPPECPPSQPNCNGLR